MKLPFTCSVAGCAASAAGAFFSLLAISILFTTVAATLVVFCAPKSRGGPSPSALSCMRHVSCQLTVSAWPLAGGFPYVVAYLNGTYLQVTC